MEIQTETRTPLGGDEDAQKKYNIISKRDENPLYTIFLKPQMETRKAEAFSDMQDEGNSRSKKERESGRIRYNLFYQMEQELKQREARLKELAAVADEKK